MDIIRLGTLVSIKTGKLDANKSDIDGMYPFFTCSVEPLRINQYSYDCECVLLAGNGDLNVKYYEGKFDAYQRTYIIESNNKNILDVKYLYYFLSSYIDILRNSSIGGVIKYIKLGNLTEAPIPLPSIEIQKKIVTAMERAYQLIVKRKEQIQACDELIKSQFIEMFGDPIINNKQYETQLGENVFKLSNGKTVPQNKRLNEGIPAYGGNGISYYTEEVLFEKDTIVVGRVGFQSGNVHIVKGPLWITDNAMYISEIFDSGYELEFLYALMEHIDFTRFQDPGDLKKITQKPFMQMEYIKPPLPLQKEYIAFVQHTNKLKFEMEQSLVELENNFSSLMKRAFKGELF